MKTEKREGDGMIARAYYWCLWYLGFSDKDHNLTTPDDREKITFMLRRSQQRMKLFWAVLTLGTFMLLDALIWAQHRWYLIPVYLFLAWLFWHVLWPYKPPEEVGQRPPRRRKEND